MLNEGALAIYPLDEKDCEGMHKDAPRYKLFIVTSKKPSKKQRSSRGCNNNGVSAGQWQVRGKFANFEKVKETT